jgi:hypothetical protein
MRIGVEISRRLKKRESRDGVAKLQREEAKIPARQRP